MPQVLACCIESQKAAFLPSQPITTSTGFTSNAAPTGNIVIVGGSHGVTFVRADAPPTDQSLIAIRQSLPF